MIELEKTYLAKKLPNGLKNCRFKEIIDIYIPKTKKHPTLRIRKNGNKFEITKKEPVNCGDASHQEEQTIVLTAAEYNALSKIDSKKVRKLRYLYKYKGRIAEIDIFQDDLMGLVVVDFEFVTMKGKDSFKMPSFCLSDITQDTFIAGGMICGKKYENIKKNLEKYNYKKLFLK